jgi:uncharacterized protein
MQEMSRDRCGVRQVLRCKAGPSNTSCERLIQGNAAIIAAEQMRPSEWMMCPMLILAFCITTPLFRVEEISYARTDGTRLTTVAETFGESHEAELVYDLLRADATAARAAILAGADINASGRREVTPLLYLVAHQEVKAVKLALQLGADPNLAAEDIDSPLYYALQMDRWEELMKMLVTAGADVAQASRMSRFHHRVPIEHLLLRRHIVRLRGPGTNIKVAASFPAQPDQALIPLWWLLEQGGDVNAQDFHGDSLMLAACETRHFDIAYWLLERGANPLIRHRDGESFASWLKRWPPEPLNDAEAGWIDAIGQRVDRLSKDPEIVRQADERNAQFAEFIKQYREVYFAGESKGLELQMRRIPARVQGAWDSTVPGSPLAASEDIFADSHVKDLVEAMSRGDAEAATKSIEAGAGINARGRNEVTPLLFLIADQNVEGIELALKLGADPNLTAEGIDSPLQYAMKCDRWEELMKMLVSAGADVQKAYDLSQYHYHVSKSPIEHVVLRHITRRPGSDRKIKVAAKFPAQRGGTVAPLWWLLKSGGNVNAQFCNGDDLLFAAWATRHFDIAYGLLVRGANPLICRIDGESFASWLHRWPAQSLDDTEAGWIDAIQQMVDKLSKDPEVIGQAVEINTAFAGIFEPDRKRDPCAPPRLTQSPHTAPRAQTQWYVSADGKRLARAAEIFGDSPVTELVQALLRVDAVTAGRLIDAGADINASGRNEVTPLLFLIADQNVEGVELALKLGADPDLTAQGIDSPLYYAVQTFTGDALLKILIAAGADVEKASSLGRLNYVESLESLVMYAGFAHRSQHLRFTAPAAFPARPGGRIEALWWLLENGGNVNALSAGGSSLLFAASRRGHFDVAYELLERGANPLTRAPGSLSFAEWVTRNQLVPSDDVAADWVAAIQRKVDRLQEDPKVIRRASEIQSDFVDFYQLYKKTPHGAANVRAGSEMDRIIGAFDKLIEERVGKDNLNQSKK